MKKPAVNPLKALQIEQGQRQLSSETNSVILYHPKIFVSLGLETHPTMTVFRVRNLVKVIVLQLIGSLGSCIC